MRRVIGSGIVVAAAIVAAIVVITVFQGAGALGCPTALLEGELVEDGGALAVAPPGGGPAVGVEWPPGYGVGTEDGRLVLTRLFAVVARLGDRVVMGGGEGGENRFRACGPVAIRSG